MYVHGMYCMLGCVAPTYYSSLSSSIPTLSQLTQDIKHIYVISKICT